MTKPANVQVTVIATDGSEWYYYFKHLKSYDAAIKAALQQFAVDTKDTSPRKAFFYSKQQGDFTKIVITFD